MQKIYPFFLVHSGCPHRCQFCNQRVSSGFEDSHTPTYVASVAAGLEEINEVALYGGSFTLLPMQEQRAYLAALEPALAAGRISGIRISTRPDAIDRDRLDLLSDYGVTTVELGCQSFDERVLAGIERGHSSSSIVEAVGLLKEAGISIGLQLMVGLPGEEFTGSARSVCRAVELAPDFLRLSPTLVLAGSGLEQRWQQGGYRPLPLVGAVEFCADAQLYCTSRGVPVARMGLHNAESLDRDRVLAGPLHQAFGQLVKSALWRRAILAVGIDGTETVTEGGCEVYLSVSDLSDAQGHKKENLHRFYNEGVQITLHSCTEINRGDFRIGGRTYSMMKVTNYAQPEFWC